MSQQGTSSSLREVPFPRILADLVVRNASANITLRHQNLEKAIILQEGEPVFASSNVVDETLGRFIARRGIANEETIFKALAESVSSNRFLGEVLVEMGVLTPHELFASLRRSFGLRILDAFRWSDGEVTVTESLPDLDQKLLLRVDPYVLLIRGVCNYSPYEQLQKDGSFDPDRAWLLDEADWDSRKLSVRPVEERMARILLKPGTIREVAERASVEDELAFRFVYALSLLRIADAPEAVTARREGEVPQTGPTTQDAPATSEDETPPLTETEAARIDNAYLQAKSQNYFQLLGVRKDPSFEELRRAFLRGCEEFSPMAWSGRELGERRQQIEDYFLTLSRAFVTLADIELRERYLERLGGRPKRTTEDKVASPFAIDTTLLDASVHLKNGTKLFNAKNSRQALEHFKFALDLEPDNPQALAYYGYCLFAVDSLGNYDEALQHIQTALERDPDYALAHFFVGRVHEVNKNHGEARRAYSRCLRIDPYDQRAKAGLQRCRIAMG